MGKTIIGIISPIPRWGDSPYEQFAIEAMAIEIVDFPMNSMDGFSSSLYKRLPGRVDWGTFTPTPSIGKIWQANVVRVCEVRSFN